MISIKRVFRLFTWHTVEVLALSAIIGTSIFIQHQNRKQDKKKIDELIDQANFAVGLQIKLFDIISLIERLDNSLKEIKYNLTNFKKEFNEHEKLKNLLSHKHRDTNGNNILSIKEEPLNQNLDAISYTKLALDDQSEKILNSTRYLLSSFEESIKRKLDNCESFTEATADNIQPNTKPHNKKYNVTHRLRP